MRKRIVARTGMLPSTMPLFGPDGRQCPLSRRLTATTIAPMNKRSLLWLLLALTQSGCGSVAERQYSYLVRAKEGTDVRTFALKYSCVYYVPMSEQGGEWRPRGLPSLRWTLSDGRQAVLKPRNRRQLCPDQQRAGIESEIIVGDAITAEHLSLIDGRHSNLGDERVAIVDSDLERGRYEIPGALKDDAGPPPYWYTPVVAHIGVDSFEARTFNALRAAGRIQTLRGGDIPYSAASTVLDDLGVQGDVARALIQPELVEGVRIERFKSASGHDWVIQPDSTAAIDLVLSTKADPGRRLLYGDSLIEIKSRPGAARVFFDAAANEYVEFFIDGEFQNW